MKSTFAAIIKWLAEYYKDIIVCSISITVAWTLIYRIIPPPITLLMVTRVMTSEGKLSYKYVDESNISPYVKVCAMASEDQNLPFHSGMDIEAIRKALKVNQKSKKLYGASTISQQVAKNVFLFPQRSYIRKGLELYFTFLIETFWPKNKILEMYLNVAEMGEHIFGIEMAAKLYFGKSASQLSIKESAIIIAILPSPRKYSVRNPGNYVASRQSEIVSLYYSLDGNLYIRELYVKADKSLYDFSNYRK
jgi:monofunctional biosynthetic peptidoglycan transglycosylase